MSRQYTLVQSLLPRVLAMREEGCTYRQIADQPPVDCKRNSARFLRNDDRKRIGNLADADRGAVTGA